MLPKSSTSTKTGSRQTALGKEAIASLAPDRHFTTSRTYAAAKGGIPRHIHINGHEQAFAPKGGERAIIIVLLPPS